MPNKSASASSPNQNEKSPILKLYRGFFSIHTTHRVDIGEHRIVYEVTGAVVMIEIIDKRNDGNVYKKF
jgi:mRNA-degrading endonuclease RelE of RelBE toxin-antitoxin system